MLLCEVNITSQSINLNIVEYKSICILSIVLFTEVGINLNIVEYKS